jgi:predicted nucleic acid-binding protein
MGTGYEPQPSMRRRVIDTSVVAAIVFDDASGDLQRLSLESRDFVAPSIIRYEFLNVCIKKHRLGKIDGARALDAWREFEEMEISTEYVSFPETLAIATRYRLSGYDAAYLWFAMSQNLELVTLDEQLAKAWRKAVEGLVS